MLRPFIKIFSAFFLSLAFYARRAAAQIYQQDPDTTLPPEKQGLDTIRTNLDGSGVVRTDSVRDLVVLYINFILPLLALAVFAGFVYAGFLYATAMGVEDQTGKAKKIFLYSAIGILIVILSYGAARLLTSDFAQGIANP